MFLYNKGVRSARILLRQARLFSTKDVGSLYDFKFESSISTEQQNQILETLNESSNDKLSGYNIPLAHIKNIHQWKNKNGLFTSIHDILEVDGMSGKLLDRICNNIVNNVQSDSKSTNSLGNNKRLKHVVMPMLSDSVCGAVQQIVAIHISLAGMSWAKISRDNNTVLKWCYEDFRDLPKKMTSIDTFNLAINTLTKMPSGDLYIFEQQDSGASQSVKQTAIYTQQNELVSMLIALLNTSAHHNLTLKNLDADKAVTSIENRIYFLKHRLSARLFRTLVGNERVSAVNMISRLVKKEKLQVPCTSIVTNEEIQSFFFSQTPAAKELLCQALMLGMCFMDLCVYKNQASFQALRSRRN